MTDSALTLCAGMGGGESGVMVFFRNESNSVWVTRGI